MSNERTLKKIFNTNPEGKRGVGRPRLRWENGIVQDTRVLGVNSWKKAPLDRDEWARPGSTRDCRANDDDDDEIVGCLPFIGRFRQESKLIHIL
jgi:hypothetical protein